MDIYKQHGLIGAIVIGIIAFGCSHSDSTNHQQPMQDASADALLSGRWVSVDADKRIRLAFDMSEKDGQVAGAIWIADPATHEWLYNGVLSGTHQGTIIKWKGASIMSFRGTLSGSTIEGKIAYAAWDDQPARSYPLSLAMEAP